VGVTHLARGEPRCGHQPSLIARVGIDTLRSRRIAGAGLDVFAVEPLPLGSPLHSLDNTILTAHLGYSTFPQFQVGYEQVVENIAAWQAGKPIRKLQARAPGEVRDNGFWIAEGAEIEQQR
jgi:hypothetical protein